MTRTPYSRSMPLRIASISPASPRPFSTRLAPSLANSFAMPRPMPLVDPVTIATFPFNIGNSFGCSRNATHAKSRSRCRLCFDRRHRAERDRKPVPRVDGSDQNGQVCGLRLGEVLPEFLIGSVGRMRFGDQRHRLGPRERRTFAIGVDGRLAPGVQEIEPRLGLAMLARILRVDAEGAAVDLRGAGPDKLDQRQFEVGRLDLGLNGGE